MKERTCWHCGDTVAIAARGEMVEGGPPPETPYQHFERTGHAFNEPVIHRCRDCDYVWGYSGDSDRPTCANCRGKRTEPMDRAEDPDG